MHLRSGRDVCAQRRFAEKQECIMKKNIQFRLNGKPIRLSVDSDRMLLWVLRTDLGLSGAKYGCGKGYCGACTVLLNNSAIRSCQIPVEAVKDQEVVTIEGLERNGRLHPLQQAFVEHDALQCGFCTPGMILTAYSLLRENPKPTTSEIIKGMDHNLCRCGAHNRIIRAIESAAQVMAGGW
jgi:aerobic-type carbon monoxide dehydrogenase small subunit (CoxS/CutS family)